MEAPTLIFWSIRPTKPGTTGLLRVPTDSPRHVRTTNLKHNHTEAVFVLDICLRKDQAFIYASTTEGFIFCIQNLVRDVGILPRALALANECVHAYESVPAYIG